MLYLVPTPIGNLGDITRRAVEILQQVDFIIAEDTRYSQKLLSHLGIHKPLISCFQPREQSRARTIVPRLARESAALITDSGSPAVSDPGHILVQEALAAGVEVVPLPGPTAFVPALTASGLSADRFVFLGFPPRRGGELRRFLESLQALPFTLIFYEAPGRTTALLRQAAAVFGDRDFAVAKELSKKNERIYRGRLGDLPSMLEQAVFLGEITVLIAGASGQEKEAAQAKIEISTLEDIYRHFETEHAVPRNKLKRVLMKRHDGH